MLIFDPIPERQDLRAFFLNWVAVFVPGVPSSLTGQMAAWMGEHESADETVWGFCEATADWRDALCDDR